ncbi:DUF4382 domain-containing protein [Bernardetia sp. ABR2-2B]|uniref:DUF4382 domain-containing protein n=1 Tax=Bernardetia sp. ABR2-2B TaxID=3127472 RepID=UPI0030CF9F24
MKIHYLFILLLSISLFSCNKEKESGQAKLEVRLVDAPADYEAVYIDVQEIRIHTSETAADEDQGWTTLPTNTGIYNLLELTNGIDALLATEELPAGKVSQIRLILGENNTLVEDGETIPLRTPSAQQSGLKLKINTTLEADLKYVIVLDFDAARSIVKAGNSGNYNLKPVIRTFVESDGGSLKGCTSAVTIQSLVTVSQNGGVVATAYTNDGCFLVKGLPAGTYQVRVEPPVEYAPVTISDVVVIDGEVNTLDTITIQ